MVVPFVPNIPIYTDAVFLSRSLLVALGQNVRHHFKNLVGSGVVGVEVVIIIRSQKLFNIVGTLRPLLWTDNLLYLCLYIILYPKH